MNALDEQMRQWSSRLRDDLGVPADASNRLGTTIAAEVRSLSSDAKQLITGSPGVRIKDRISELVAFQRWVDIMRSVPAEPALTRAHVLTQNYICFVYLGEACFKGLRKAPPGSVSRACATFLTDNPVRAFRNAVAHGNWRYLADFTGLEFWAKKGSEKDEPMLRWTVSQQELNFWQSLSRCTAYATYATLDASSEP